AVAETVNTEEAEAPVAEAAETADAVAEEPVKMVLLWRPGRHDNRGREQGKGREQNRNRPQGNRRAPAKDGAPADAAKDNAGDNQNREG
ncbi:hypothetical protein NSR98_25415, partial [Salmonella enterica]|nr:hypothetical protein [Salmonella enterica]